MTSIAYFSLTTIGTLAASIAFSGLALSILWGWFIVPLGVAEITVAHGVGIFTIIRMLATDPGATQTESKTMTDIISMLFGPAAFSLLLGYCAKLFM